MEGLLLKLESVFWLNADSDSAGLVDLETL